MRTFRLDDETHALVRRSWLLEKLYRNFHARTKVDLTSRDLTGRTTVHRGMEEVQAAGEAKSFYYAAQPEFMRMAKSKNFEDNMKFSLTIRYGEAPAGAFQTMYCHAPASLPLAEPMIPRSCCRVHSEKDQNVSTINIALINHKQDFDKMCVPRLLLSSSLAKPPTFLCVLF